jgi:hypothetical protein
MQTVGLATCAFHELGGGEFAAGCAGRLSEPRIDEGDVSCVHWTKNDAVALNGKLYDIPRSKAVALADSARNGDLTFGVDDHMAEDGRQ